MCRNLAFPSQLLQCQAASCVVSFAGPTRSLVFIYNAMHTILHLKKAGWGQLSLIISLMRHYAAMGMKLLFPKPLFLVRMDAL